jgi:hypothetical protein
LRIAKEVDKQRLEKLTMHNYIKFGIIRDIIININFLKYLKIGEVITKEEEGLNWKETFDVKSKYGFLGATRHNPTASDISRGASFDRRQKHGSPTDKDLLGLEEPQF